jgi:hypothetical protein
MHTYPHSHKICVVTCIVLEYILCIVYYAWFVTDSHHELVEIVSLSCKAPITRLYNAMS